MGSLPDYVDMEVTATLKKQISDILVDNSDPENRIKFYDDWCDKYDEDLVVVGNYTGHTKCVEAFLQLELNRNIAVLDLACGTGLLGAEVTTDHHNRALNARSLTALIVVMPKYTCRHV